LIFVWVWKKKKKKRGGGPPPPPFFCNLKFCYRFTTRSVRVPPCLSVRRRM